jgi:hypothetical protein
MKPRDRILIRPVECIHSNKVDRERRTMDKLISVNLVGRVLKRLLRPTPGATGGGKARSRPTGGVC